MKKGTFYFTVFTRWNFRCLLSPGWTSCILYLQRRKTRHQYRSLKHHVRKQQPVLSPSRRKTCRKDSHLYNTKSHRKREQKGINLILKYNIQFYLIKSKKTLKQCSGSALIFSVTLKLIIVMKIRVEITDKRTFDQVTTCINYLLNSFFLQTFLRTICEPQGRGIL